MNKPIEIAIEDIDLGTPAALSDSTVTVHIDGQAVEVPAGTSVMRAASLAGTQIPKLCATDSLDAFGSCRLCLVEIEGRKGTPSSCTTRDVLAPPMTRSSTAAKAAAVDGAEKSTTVLADAEE